MPGESEADQPIITTGRVAVRRVELDKECVQEFAGKFCGFYPGCPVGWEKVITEHTCFKYSGRVGLSTAVKDFSAEAINLAVRAHIHHVETDYDSLPAQSYDRHDACSLVEEKAMGGFSKREISA